MIFINCAEMPGWNTKNCQHFIMKTEKEDEFIDRAMPFQKYACPVCGKDVFGVVVYISSQGKEDFVEECVSYDESFSEEDWIDAFECIAFSLSCKECGSVQDGWAVLETM